MHSRHTCMYFDSSSGSFQSSLCCTQRHYVHVRTSTYQYVCLGTYADYGPVRAYTIICTYIFAYVSLRQYTNVVGLRSYTCQYVLKCKYVGLRTTMTYNVLRAYTYLFGSFFINTYNTRIPLPIYTNQYWYIRVIRINVQTHTTKICTNMCTKIPTCKYVQ